MENAAGEVLRCPSCGETTNDGVEFVYLEPYKAVAGSLVEGVDESGRLLLLALDRGDAERFYQPELRCGDCGHQWPTKRLVGRKDSM